MKLPNIPYPLKNYEHDTLQFRGLNLSPNFADGEFCDMSNVSTGQYPQLTQRAARHNITNGYHNLTDVFEWDNHVVLVDGETLYYDDVAIGTVKAGKKQFAVVNTKLIIWPDMLYIDLTNNKVFRLDSAFTVGGGALSISENTLTFDSEAEDYATNTFGGAATEYNPAIYCYGTDAAAVEACFDEESGWDMSALEALPGAGLYGVFSGENPSGAAFDVNGWLTEGMIFIPREQKYDFAYVWADSFRKKPDITKYTKNGYYGVFTYAKPNYVSAHGDSNVMWHFNIFKVGESKAKVSAYMSVGDYISIASDPFGFVVGEFLRIEAMQEVEGTSTITFSEGTALATPPARIYVDKTYEAGNTYGLKIYGEERYYVIYPTEDIAQSAVLYADSSNYIHVRETDENGTWRETRKYLADLKQEADLPVGTITYLSGENTYSLILSKEIPHLDYICSHDNRLYGVSNKVSSHIYNAITQQFETFESRCIYVSSLGLPDRFWDFDGTAADSYQVAVGSEGDFTAICEYGNSVCCFKENRLHKLMGSYPEEYYLTETKLEGVQAGSWASLCNVNEVLYYKGVGGVYAYTGGTPSRISAALDNIMHSYGNAVGGSDRECYYLAVSLNSASDAMPNWSAKLFTYDIYRGLWSLVETDTKYTAFSAINSNGIEMLMLTAAPDSGDGTARLYSSRVGDTDGDEFAWSAELCPMTENIFERRRYTKLIIRASMDAGAVFNIEIKSDGQPWKTAYMSHAREQMSFSVPLPVDRTDKLHIRFSGRGRTRIEGIQREFYIGSEK